MSLKNLIDLVRDFAARQGIDASENSGAVNLAGPFADADDQDRWLRASVEPVPPPFVSVNVIHATDSRALEADDGYRPNRRFLLTVKKADTASTAWFVFGEHAVSWLQSGAWRPECRVFDLAEVQAVTTRVGVVSTWDAPAAAPFDDRATTRLNAAAWVRDPDGRTCLSPDLRRWMPVGASRDSPWPAWAALASLNLARGLCDRLTERNAVNYLEFAGPPPLLVDEADPEIMAGFTTMLVAAEWVLLAEDREVRHRFLSAELGRANPRAGFLQQLAQALEVAKLIHVEYARSTGREALKASADLRKSVFDETQRISQRASDLAAGLAKDVPAAAAPFVIKVLGDAPKVDDFARGTGVGSPHWLFVVAALYLLVSAFLQTRTALAFVQLQTNSRAGWLRSLRAHLSSEEIAEAVEQPLDASVDHLLKVNALVVVVYILLALGLGFVATQP